MEASPARPPQDRDWGMLIRSSLVLIRSSLVPGEEPLGGEEPGGREEFREEIREVSRE